jgi:Thiol-disulfide isomerase and thioredoxins
VDRSHKGSESPALTVADPSGRKLALADLRGKPVLINLWATWCAPCVAELPTLQALAGKGTVRVLAISQDSGDPAAVAKFLADRKLDRLEPWIDPDSDLSFHYNTGILPTTVLYDSSGREVWRYAGEHDWSGPEAAALIAEAR